VQQGRVLAPIRLRVGRDPGRQVFAAGRQVPRGVARGAERCPAGEPAGPLPAVVDECRNGVSPLTAWADLHPHSTASDGTLAPSEVVRLAAAAGLHTIALTDHDTLGGVGEATRAGAVLGIRVIPGCEFSVRGDWGELHLLGYFLPDDDPSLLAML